MRFLSMVRVQETGQVPSERLMRDMNKLIEEMNGGVNLPGHHQNFLDAITKGAAPAAPASVGHVSAGICHLANISTRLRKTVEFDPRKEQDNQTFANAYSSLLTFIANRPTRVRQRLVEHGF